MPRLAIALTTTHDRAAALSLGRAVVRDSLAACATIVPGARSIYRWKGALEEMDEAVVLIKTTAASLPALRRRLRALHTDELPEDLALAATAGSAYARWVGESTKRRKRPR